MAGTWCGPAKGRMMLPLWTFKGKVASRNRTKGAALAKWQLTENGWPDEVTWILWVREFIAEIKARGLTKALLYCDNADLHANIVALELLEAANVRLVALIPSATGRMQPLDVCFFGPLKVIVDALATADNVVLSNDNVAYFYEKAVTQMEANAPSSSPLASAFRKSGLYPHTMDVSTDADFAPSDARLGLAADHPEVIRARTLTAEEVGIVIDAEAARWRPDFVKKVREFNAAESKKGVMNLSRIVYTDASFAESIMAKTADKEAAAAGVIQRREARQHKKAMREAALAEKRDSKAARVVQAAARVAKSAARASTAEGTSPTTDVGNPYQKGYAGHKRKRG